MLHATHGARGDIDGRPRTSQPSELSTENGGGSEDDECSDTFDTEESAAVADDVDETRPPGYVSYDDAPQLAPEALFFVGLRCRFGRTVRFNERFFRQ